MSNRIAILQARPSGYQHAAAFNEIAIGLKGGFAELGYSATITDNQIVPNARHVVLGGHLLSIASLMSLPEDTVIYNFEQLSETNWTLSDPYKQALCQFEVWDYSPQGQ